jgi:hypothetical protein
MQIEGPSGDLSKMISPIKVLSGRADYRLFAKVILKPPLVFQHQGSYHLWKVRFTHQQVPFPILIEEGKIDLSNSGCQWSGAKIEFEDSSFLTNGSWKKEKGGNPFEMMAKGRGELKTLFRLAQSPLISEEIRSKTKWIDDVSGKVELSFKGWSRSGFDFSSYDGEVIPKGVLLLPKGASFPLILKEGSLSFSNLGVAFSKLKAQFDSSSLTLDGVIKEENMSLSAWGSIDLKQFFSLLESPFSPEKIRSQIDEIKEINGRVDGHLKWIGKMEDGVTGLQEGEIRMRGISLQHQRIGFPLSHVEGSLLLSPEEFRLVGLKGMAGASPFDLSGVLSRINTPDISGKKSSSASGRLFSFRFQSPQLDLDEILPKKEGTSTTSFEKLKDLLSDWSFDGKVEVDRGKFRDLQFQDLKIEMKTVGGKLDLHSFQFKGFEGDLWGEGWIQPTARGIGFEIKPRLSNMEAKAFLRTLLQREKAEEIMLTGRVHVDKVELRGEGGDFQGVKESLNGQLRLEMENGVIERGNILAKIFSILNVSQWIWGRLPDLTTKGLPYRTITANILVKDGIASTDDFLVDGDAMRITLLGKVDVGKNLIDATIGIHPLVTVDMLLSNVPVAGYILTGKDKAFLSYIYEVKGDLGDPKIEPIPLKGMGENFWGIMRRMLETPMRPFQKNPSQKQ